MTENPRIHNHANRWSAKFAAKEKISNATLTNAVERAESGLIKRRIVRQGQGKPGGCRSIPIYRILVSAFAKVSYRLRPSVTNP